MVYSIEIERDRLAPVLDYLARHIVSRHTTIPQLSMVELTPEAGGLRIRATSLDVWASVQLPGTAEGEAGSVLAGAHVLRDFVKRQPRGSVITMSWKLGAQRVSLVCGQARSSIGGECHNSFPATPEVAGCHAFTLPDGFGADLELVAPFAAKEDVNRPWLHGVALERFAGGLAMVATDGFGMSAATYPLPHGADDLPGVIIDQSTIGALRGAIKLHRGQPVDIRIDRALVALTVGAVEIVARPIVEAFPRWENIFHGLDDLAPIALPEIDPSIPVPQLVRMKRAHGKNELIWQGNGYTSLVTCAGNDRWAGVVMHNPDAPTKGYHAEGDTYELNGLTRPLRTKGGIIELTAYQVRAMCGPIDPSTFVDIPRGAYYQGAPVPADCQLPAAPKIDPSRALSMTAAEMAAYAEACRPIAIDVGDAMDDRASECAVVIVPDAEPVTVQAAPAAAPILQDNVETMDDNPAMTSSEPGPADLVARIEALEAVIQRMGIAIGGNVVESQPRRSERHEQALRAAWRHRAAKRAAVAQLRQTEIERDSARAEAETLKAKRQAVRETLLRMRARRNEAARDALNAREEARAAVSAMSVLTERWAAVQAVRSDEPRLWAPSERRPLRLAA